MVRILRHLFIPPWQAKRVFPRRVLDAIGQAIAQSESAHMGELRFAVEAALDIPHLLRGASASSRALEVFSNLRVWDTEGNSGVLVYLLLAERQVEIVADRGIHAKVGSAEWERICRMMEGAFRENRFEQGVLDGIREITVLLARHFPATGANPNELPDAPVLI